MINPFKAIAQDVGDLYHSARHSDVVSPGLGTTGAVIATPIVVLVSLVRACVTKKGGS